MFKLTGEVRYRITRWRRKVVLEVRETPPNRDMSRWRDASPEDLFAIAEGGPISIDVPRLRVVK